MAAAAARLRGGRLGPPAAAATARPVERQAAAPWPWPESLAAVAVAPQFQWVQFENGRVRVRKATVGPHQREPVHTHRWPGALCKEQAGTGRCYDAAGQPLHELTAPCRQGPGLERARRPAPEGPHAVENTGEVAGRFVRIALRQ